MYFLLFAFLISLFPFYAAMKVPSEKWLIAPCGFIIALILLLIYINDRPVNLQNNSAGQALGLAIIMLPINFMILSTCVAILIKLFVFSRKK